jgi:hypothetical protein
MIVSESARKVCEFIFCVIVLIDDEFYFSSSGARILFVDVDDRVGAVLAVRTLKQTEQDQVSWRQMDHQIS